MPGLNKHSKLVTPNQLAFLILAGVAWALYFYEVDVWYHLGKMRYTVATVFRFVGF